MADIKKNCQEKILKINEYLSSFISNKPPQQTSDEKQSTVSKTHPANRSDFESRLSTFECGTWLILEISPLQCAQNGWNCHDASMLKCATCDAFLCTTLPSRLERDAYNHALTLLKSKLKEHHKVWCGWRDNSSPDEFTKPPLTLSVHYLNCLREYTADLLSLNNNLPYFSSQQMLTKLGIEADDLKIVVKSRELNETELTSCMLSLCGWRLTKKNQIRCNMCLRSIGLWNFYTLEEKHQYEEVEAQKLVTRDRRKVRAIEMRERQQAGELERARLLALEQVRIEAELALGEDRLLEGDVADPSSDVDEEELMLLQSEDIMRPSTPMGSVMVPESGGNSTTISNPGSPKLEPRVPATSVEESIQRGVAAEKELSCSATDVGQPGECSLLQQLEPASTELPCDAPNVVSDEVSPAADGDHSTMEADSSVAPADDALKQPASNGDGVSWPKMESSHDDTSYNVPAASKRKRTSDEWAESSNKRTCPQSNDSSDSLNGSVAQEEEIVDVEHSKHLFDPIEEHRFWCGWVASVGETYSSANRKGFMVIPPQLKDFQSKMEDTNLIASETFSKNVEGLRAVRTILEASIHEEY